jgi:hypothetical protein
MPDTGAPWNIPYADPTDLVRDWPQLSQDIAEAVADGLDNAGFVKQVVQTVKLDTFSSTTAGWNAVTGLAVTITPTSDTNKIILLGQFNVANSNTANAHAAVRVTGGNAGTFVGDADGSRTRSAINFGTDVAIADFATVGSSSFVYMDSPGVTTAVTYQVEVNRNAGTIFVNRSSTDSNSALYQRSASSIVAIEVAA